MADQVCFKKHQCENMPLAFTGHAALCGSQHINIIIWNNEYLCIQSFNSCFQDSCVEGGLQHACCTIPCFGYRAQLLLFLNELSKLFLQRHIFTMYLFNKWMLQKMGDWRTLFKILDKTPVSEKKQSQAMMISHSGMISVSLLCGSYCTVVFL